MRAIQSASRVADWRPTGRRRTRQRPGDHDRPRDERGVSMLELVVAMTTFAILLAVALPIVSTLLRTTSRVDATYSNIDEQLWLSTTLQRLARSAVAPEPTLLGKPPAPAFTNVSPTSVTFTANMGSKTGPERVTASCAPTTSTRCAKDSTFSVKVTPAKAGTCPTTATTTAHTCTYGGPSHYLVQVPNVRNATATTPLPLFVYTYATRSAATGVTTNVTVCEPPGTAPVTPTAKAGTCEQSDATAFQQCRQEATTAFTITHPFSACHLGEIVEVHYVLMVNGSTSTLNGGAQAEDDTGVFSMSPTSMLFEPSVR